MSEAQGKKTFGVEDFFDDFSELDLTHHAPPHPALPHLHHHNSSKDCLIQRRPSSEAMCPSYVNPPPPPNQKEGLNDGEGTRGVADFCTLRRPQQQPQQRRAVQFADEMQLLVKPNDGNIMVRKL